LSTLPAKAAEDTYSPAEITTMAEGLFGDTTEGLAKAIEKTFADLGYPNDFIAGEEISVAIGIGLRYGQGLLDRKSAELRKVFWQGPSLSWDLGGNASKIFTLVYKLYKEEQLFQRFPVVDGSFYFVAGLGVSYQQFGAVTLAPIGTGVGFRTHSNGGYLHYGTEHS
jgi:hypothetical protein